MAYAEIPDLMLGQLAVTLPPTVDRQQFINMAAEHIDARLAPRYEVPILIQTMPYQHKVLLKSINSKMATGRIILTLATPGENVVLHAYGARLLEEADIELAAIANGEIILDADPAPPFVGDNPIPDPEDLDPYARIPGATNRDDYSATAAFEAVVHQSTPGMWAPNDGALHGPSYDFRRRAGG